MADFNVLIPKLGESVQEGTITKIFVKTDDIVREDDPLFELATDKVDSEIPSPVAGRVKEILGTENETYPVGKVIMVISTGESETKISEKSGDFQEEINSVHESPVGILSPERTSNKSFSSLSEIRSRDAQPSKQKSDRFYSPLVKNIAAKEGISFEELNTLKGSGLGGRVQKKDITTYIEQLKAKKTESYIQPFEEEKVEISDSKTENSLIYSSPNEDDTIIPMDRVRKLIANHMVMSKKVSAHVTTIVEADVTNIFLWRKKVKDLFSEKYGEKLTYLPIFTEAVAKALAEYKRLNGSVDGDNIILHKHINIGIAVAKDDGNLIVPVIKDADAKNLTGLTKELNSLSNAARNNRLNPDNLQDGTFTITNFGSFGNLIGTPIINQPQVAILAVGLIEKKPSVIETPTGDAIVVRHKMYLSLSYDHRVIDGMLGGKFLRRIADLLEQFDIKREI